MPEKDKPSSVQALARGLGILSLFTAERRSLGVSELSRRTGLHRTTVYRFAKTLESEGYLAYDAPNAVYTIGPAWAAALYSLGSDNVLADILNSDLHTLAAEIEETVALAVRHGDSVHIVNVMVPSRMFVPNLPPTNSQLLSETWNVHCQVLLAHANEETKQKALAVPTTRYTENTMVDPGAIRARLLRVAQEGVSYDREENALGVCAMAVPVFVGEKVVAALGAIVPVERFVDSAVAVFRVKLRSGADAMGRRLELADTAWSTLR